MPLPAADEGMPLFLQPQVLRDSANVWCARRDGGARLRARGALSVLAALTSPKGRGKGRLHGIPRDQLML